MQSPRYLCSVCALALFFLPASAQRVHQASVRKVSVVSVSPFQLQVQTSEAVSTQTQIVSGRERLVIDIPNAVPGPGLRGIVINRGEVRGVRVSLFSAAPPVTRIVVDLNQPQWYRIVPNAAGVLVSLGSDAENAINGTGDAPTIGWVSAKAAAKPTNDQSPSFVVVAKTSAARKNATNRLNGASVQFSNGLLTIHGGGATLSDILFKIQKQTGAEIAIPSGTEQDRVGADFGPGTTSEVLGELLNGAGLNFVVVGSEADPKVLRSVLLTHKSSGTDAPFIAQPYTSPPTAENIVPENGDPGAAQPDETAPQSEQPPAGGPPPDPPPG
jgi:hypothetical protein